MKQVKTTTPEVSPVFADTELQKFFEKEFNQLKELYWSKLKLIKVLDPLIRKCYSEDLSDTLEEYQVILHRQARRLQDVFSTLELSPETAICEMIKNEITDICGLIEELPAGYKRDSEIVAAILRMEDNCNTINEELSEFATELQHEKLKTFFSETQMESKLLVSRFSYFSRKNIKTLEIY